MKRLYLIVLASLIISINLQAQSATQLFQEGRDAFSDKLFSRSIESFKEFIQQYPSDPRVDQSEYLIGVSLFYQRRFTKTISHFQQYEKNYPGSAYLRRIHYWKGLSYYGLENYRSAINELKKQSQIFEELYFRQKSLQILGYSYEKTDQFEKAGESYKELYESDPGKELSALALERQGYIQLKLENYREALYFFDKVAVEYSTVPQIQKEIPFYQGECYYQLEEFENSLKKFETFLTLYSSSANREKAVFRVGSLYARLNNQDSAMEYMSLLTEEYPESVYIMDAHIILAESYMADGNMTEARKSLSKLLDNEKNPVEIQKLQFNMARTFEENTDEALKWYLAASKGLDPDISSESLYRSAVLYDSRGEAERAVLLFERLFNQYKISPYREEVGDWIVLYYEENKQDLPLKNHLDRMLSEYESSEKRSLYLYMRGNISYRNGKYNEALRYYHNIINVEHDDLMLVNETRYRIAYIYTLRKEFYRAADYFKDILAADVKNDTYYRSLLSLGICYLNVKDNDQAEPIFKELAETDPATIWIDDAYFYLGKIQMDKGQYKKAAFYYELAAGNSESEERKVQSLYNLGWSLMRTASFKKASESFDTLYDIAPHHALAGDSLYRSGTALSYLELWTDSLERYTKALELIEFFTLREELLYQTAWSHFMLKNYNEALSYLKLLEKEFPASPLPADGLFRGAEALSDKGNTREAVNAYVLLFEEFPNSPLSETALYRALSLSQKNIEKLRLIETFLSLYSGTDRAFQTALQMSSILRMPGINENEQNIVDRILSLKLDGREKAVILLGQSYPRLKDFATITVLNDLTNLENLSNRELETIKLYKGIWNYWAGNSEEAAKAFNSIMAADDSVLSAEAQFYTARMLGDLKEWKKAGDAYLRIRYRYPDQKYWVERSIYEAALAYKKAGESESFQRTATMLNETFPESELNKKLADDAPALKEDLSNQKTHENLKDLENLSPPDDILPLLDGE